MKRRSRSRSRWWPKGRTLFLVDAENLVGSGRPSACALAAAASQLASAVPATLLDHVVVGVAHSCLIDAGVAWPGARLVVGSGPDGADHALLAQAEPDQLAARYDRVVIASGDGIFSDIAASLGALGVEVVIASRAEACSARLRLVATRVVTWAGPDEPLPPASSGGVSGRAA